MKKKVLRAILIACSAFCICGGALMGTVRAEKADQGARTENGVDDTVYCVGSVSKVYVTVAVMQLVEQGKVGLDDPVTEYVPDFEMADERYRDITVRMLMNHTSGIMGTTFENAFLLNDAEKDRGEIVLKNLKGQRLKAAPGEYAAYCNDGFDLLQLIVERVSGMEYTAYVKKYVAGPLGAKSIGTALSMFEGDRETCVYHGGINYGKEFVGALGAGGIYSTARDTCEFGSAFFKGDHRLLSEQSKREMNALSVRDPYQAYGLGWDIVTLHQYEEAGVKVLGKAGGTTGQYTFLQVAPEEEISVCVVSSGGSSKFNTAVAECLMNIALEEKGITVKEVTVPEPELLEKVPDEYRKYEGYYGAGLLGGLTEVTFPDMRYMRVKTGMGTTSEELFAYSDQGFVKVNGDVESWSVKPDKNYAVFSFREHGGKCYAVRHEIPFSMGPLREETAYYCGEKLEENPVSETALNAWKKRAAESYEVYSEKYSSDYYRTPFFKMKVMEEGYVVCSLSEGDAVMKIKDATHLESFTTVPGDLNRDLFDLCADEEENVHATLGMSYQRTSGNEKLTARVTEVPLQTGQAAWFDVDDAIANSCITVERPENSAIYVYDRFGEVTYSSQMIEWHTSIPLPKGGRVVFAGEDGGVVRIDYEAAD